MTGHAIAVQRESRAARIPSPARITGWVNTALAGIAAPVSVCVRIVDMAEARALNRRYRGRSYAPNVLSFPAGALPDLPIQPIGDIVLCAPVIVREALRQGKPAPAHWAHLVTHGVLHLLGMTHDSMRKAAAMERREICILAELGYANPYEPDE